jgi:hypothetical protein
MARVVQGRCEAGSRRLAAQTVNGQRAARGGWYGILEVYLTASYRSGADATTTNVNTGIRCARAPE